MNRLIPFVMAILLAACAQTLESPIQTKPDKYAVVHVGTGQDARHVFCVEGRCSERSPKFLPIPAPAAPAKAAQVKNEAHAKVHFRWGQASLDAAGRKEIRDLILSGKLDNARSVVIAGRTDPTGARRFNEKLALRRAQTVKVALVKAGIPPEKITATAQAPCCDGDLRASPKVMRQLRRTDILITIITQ